MPVFHMTLTRTAVQVIDIEIEADTPEQAEANALDGAGDQYFTGKTYDYEYEARATRASE
jgi:hypothetical protein